MPFYKFAAHHAQCKGYLCEFCCSFLAPSQVSTHPQECPVLADILNSKVECDVCHVQMSPELLKDHRFAHQLESCQSTQTETTSSVDEDPGDCEDGFPHFLTMRCTNRDREECNICMGSMNQGHLLKMLPCMHKFHKTCLCLWLNRQKQCPLCQIDV